MTDITKCNGKRKIEAHVYTCPWRWTCRRYLAPSGPWQSWFGEAPLEKDASGAPSCAYRLTWDNKPGSTVIPHTFEKANGAVYCKHCGWPKENHA